MTFEVFVLSIVTGIIGSVAATYLIRYFDKKTQK